MTDSEPITLNNSNGGFFNHVFNFDDDTKNTVFNLVQYTILAILPIVGLNKTIQNVFPEPNKKRSNLEILFEVIGQLVVIFVGIFFINRVVTYIPTYSKTDYPGFNLFTVVLTFMVIILSLQTKVGKKVNILVERFSDYYNGKKPEEDEEKQKKQQPKQIPRTIPTHQPSRSDAYLNSPTQHPQQQSQQQQQSQPNFNNMFSNTVEPFIGGASTIGGSPF
jgi:hypothetical protein